MPDNNRTLVHLRLGTDGRLPAYATAGSAGCDLFAARDLVLKPGETLVLPLDMVMAIESGVEAQVRPRSGLSLKTSIRVPNSPGTIDSDYRSEVGVIIQNTYCPSQLAARIAADPGLVDELSEKYRLVTLAEILSAVGKHKAAEKLIATNPDLAGQSQYIDANDNPYGTIYIQKGERIAQMVFARYLQAEFIEHDEPEAIGQNRGGGFGSTGA